MVCVKTLEHAAILTDLDVDAELKDAGSYFRSLAKAEHIMRTGKNPDAVPFEDMKALIQKRHAQ